MSLLIGGTSALISGGLGYWAFRDAVAAKRIRKVLAVVLFVVYMFRLFSIDVIDGSFHLFGTDSSSWVFSQGTSLWIFFLRWMTYLLVALAIVGPFFSERVVRNLLSFLGLSVAILNIVFFEWHVTGFVGQGNYDPFSFRSLQFAGETVLLFVICALSLLETLRNRPIFRGWKDVGTLFGVLGWMLLAYMPQSTIRNLFGDIGNVPDEFNLSHRLLIYVIFLTMTGTYFILRSKTQEDKNLFFALASLSGLFQYFYSRVFGLGNLPFHLCNTAIIMMFFAFVFKMKGVFYFSYFVNVLGAFCAIILPEYSSVTLNMSTLKFWYNHYYAFVLPILGVALRVYPRPNIKMMYKAIGIFTIYFIVVAFVNAWLNNYTPTDYFYQYGDFLSGKFNLEEFQFSHVIAFQYNGLTFKFFYLYLLGYYAAFIVLMFVMWSVYDGLFKVSDFHYDMLVRKRLARKEMRELKAELAQNAKRELPAGNARDMIEISHFTKQYKGSPQKAVDDFSLFVHGGEVFGFLGHNGAGKSTTIKSLVGIQSITSGHIRICGYDIKTQAPEAKKNIGFVSDNHAVYERMTGREYINYVAALYLVPPELRDERLEHYLERFSLQEAIDREIKGYSHGMKQKLVVISSLIHDPKVWILDEPLTGLDPTSAFQIKECMREHAAKGNAVFFASHVIEVVEKICDRIAIISEGKLNGIWSIKELEAQNLPLEKLYLRYLPGESLIPKGGE